MSMPFLVPVRQPTLAQRFMLASLIILIAGMAGIGVWIGNEIKSGVIHRTGATTALYVDSFVAPHLQELGTTGALSPESHEQLSKLLQDTPMGQQIVTFKVWDPTGKVIYSTDGTAGQTFPIQTPIPAMPAIKMIRLASMKRCARVACLTGARNGIDIRILHPGSSALSL